jgi:hypothetical protein
MKSICQKRNGPRIYRGPPVILLAFQQVAGELPIVREPQFTCAASMMEPEQRFAGGFLT